MVGLVGALVTVMEFILLGGIATIVLAYGFIWIHPVKEFFSEYYKKSKSFLSNRLFDAPSLRTAMIAFFSLGYLYFAGSVTNTVSYWVLEPSHNAELGRFYSSLRNVPECPAAAGNEIPTREWALFQRVLWSRQGDQCERRAYELTLMDESYWRTFARESASSGLDGMEKHLRLARGMAFWSLGLALLAALKLGSGLLVLAATVTLKPSRLLHKMLINDEAPDTITRVHIRTETYQAIVVYFFTALLAFGSYLVCVQSYMGVEREFHGFAYFGLKAASEKEAAGQGRQRTEVTGSSGDSSVLNKR